MAVMLARAWACEPYRSSKWLKKTHTILLTRSCVIAVSFQIFSPKYAHYFDCIQWIRTQIPPERALTRDNSNKRRAKRGTGLELFLFQRNCKFNFWGENIQPVPWEKFEQSFWDELYSETKTELDEEQNCRNWILFKTRRFPAEPWLENFERSTIWRIYCSVTDVSWVVSVGSKRLPNRRTMEKNCS